MLVTITNLSATDQIYISSAMKTIEASGTLEISRTPSEMEQDLGLKAQVVAGSVSLAFTAEASDDVSTSSPAANVPATDAAGLGDVFAIRKAFTAGVTGAADDVTVYAANAPFAMRILDVTMYVSTANAGDTITLRSATAGGGSVQSSALSLASTGVVRNAHTATVTVAKGGSIYLRRSDRDCAGEVVILVQKI